VLTCDAAANTPALPVAAAAAAAAAVEPRSVFVPHPDTAAAAAAETSLEIFSVPLARTCTKLPALPMLSSVITVTVFDPVLKLVPVPASE
jgi:hypothetical protein